MPRTPPERPRQLDLEDAIDSDRARERAEVRAKLRIDDDDLDQCLVDQPEYFYQAAMAASEAKAAHDGARLELKEVTAELDGDVRRQLIATETKFSETSVANMLINLPRIKALNQRLLILSRAADDATALKEAYIQRSYALKDLNASQQARLFNLGVERGNTSARNNVADNVRSRQEEMRRERRPGAAPERFRPRDTGD